MAGNADTGEQMVVPTERQARRQLDDSGHLSDRHNSPSPSPSIKAALHPQLMTSDLGFSMDGPLEPGYSSWSTSSDKQLGYSSPGPSDRVFPIRSVVSVDPTRTPFVAPGRSSGEYDGFPGMLVTATGAADVAAAGCSQPHNPQSKSSSESDASPVRARRSTDSQTSASNSQRQTTEPKGTARERQSNDLSVSINNKSIEGGRYGGGSRMQLFNDASSDRTDKIGSSMDTASYKSSQAGSITPSDPESNPPLVTARFKHVVTEQGHVVITGQDGDTLQRCEDEPIHIPGAIQSFGCLVALQEEAEGQLVARLVSENSKKLLGYKPEELFKLNSFTDILSEEQTDNLLDHIDFIRDEEADPAGNGPEVFTISIKCPNRKAQKFWCAMHINPRAPDTIILEFELDDDRIHPLSPSSEETPEPPEDTLNSQPTEEEYAESTHNSSKPLRVLRSARKRKGEAAAMEVFNIMSQVQEQLAAAPNLETFLKILVGVVKELTGFHRVMIYQFDSSFNGRVVTELVDPRATRDLYKGLNFPASDIPKQARELYKVNKVRLLYDRDLDTARLVCRTAKDLETPLDLSYSYLRAMSPIHLKYLANMAVRSSMSISINAFGELWGLIACHAYGSKGMRVSFPIRKMCRLVGDTASRNIERLSYASRLQARKLINTVPTETNPSGYIIASSDDLLTLFDADFGLLSIRGETKVLGKLEHSQEALAMLEYLRLRNITTMITSQDIKVDFPDLRYPPGFTVIAGLLLVPLSVGGDDFIVFFRKGQVKEVKWAGNPYQKVVQEGTEGYLEPRKSFKTWSETVVGKCREWSEEQVETGAVLCLVYGKFIEVWRQKEAALQSSQLTKLLLANSAHEVRTPLNAIINYLEIALEGALDQETRENLSKSHSASKSLIYVINDLLDLTKTEEGQELIKDEIFDLPATLREATDAFRRDANRKGIDYEFVEQPGIPKFVHGDQRRVRQAVSNLTANAMQHTTSGSVKVEVWLAECEGRRVAVDIVVQDTGIGMSDAKLDALFRDLEQVSTDADSTFSGYQDESDKNPTDSKNGRTLGLGLAVVSRIVRNMDGQLRLKSEEGKGSRFVIQLPFDLPDNRGQDDSHAENKPMMSTLSARQAPPAAEGEVMLVDKTSSIKVDAVSQKRSVDDMMSLQSFRSGSSGGQSTKSDVDRLIDAIQEPLSVSKSESVDKRPRSNSRGSGASKKSIGSLGSISVSSLPRSSHQERPGNVSRSRSFNSNTNVPEHLRSGIGGSDGLEYVQDNKTPVKAIRMPDEFQEKMEPEKSHTASRVLFDLPPDETDTESGKPNIGHLQVLVAEDDPINSRIIIKRLEKSGHRVHHTINGEECASAYEEKAGFFDVVLMDMQMPIVDGLTSTKMIRSYEKTHSQNKPSHKTNTNGRLPIIAVSASLVERDRQIYINAGFDGWILKPIDFNRLNVLFTGIVDEDIRDACLYKVGQWERGGWFGSRQQNAPSTITMASDQSMIANTPDNPDGSSQADQDATSSGSSGGDTITATQLEGTKSWILDERTKAMPELDLPNEDATN